jgi:hypothetical protein
MVLKHNVQTGNFLFNATNQLNYNIEFGKSTLDASALCGISKSSEDHSLPTNRIESIDLGPGAGYIPYIPQLYSLYAPLLLVLQE